MPDRKKKIAFFGIKFYPSKGGSSRVAEGIARSLKEKYDFTIYCYPDPQANEHLKGVNVVHIPSFPLGTLGVFLYYFTCCMHLLFSRKYDLIHVHKTDSAIFIPFLRFKSPVIATSQEAPYVRDKWSVVGKMYFRIMERFFVRSGAALTSVSKPLSQYYQEKYMRKVHYIPNGVDIIEERDWQGLAEILQQYNIDNYVFFAARRIMSTKGLHTFLSAARKVNYPYTIVIAGEHSHAQSYMQQIKDLAKGLPVKFIGYIGQRSLLMALIEKAEFFIFPSETEGLSLMLLESASTGKTPIICSDIPENTEVFDPEEVLYFVNKDSDDLGDKLIYADQNSAEMQIRAHRASQRVLEQYSIDVVAGQYEVLYEQLLDKVPG
ncbi:MAG: glycosyltransferase family 4 protein [Saprospiraceae bacterium]|nr:glycosyltransferase family 4 protein [Saprospiraceae bacterium]